MSRPIRLARTFHEMAWPFLSGLGFELQNDPDQFVGRYLATNALYKSQKGFFLIVGFDPLDGSGAGMSCGRSWNYTSKIPELRQFERLSNRYHVLARRFGFEVAKSYELRVDDEANTDIQAILNDLEATLPTILRRTTQEDLIAVEKEKHGSQWHHEMSQDHYRSTSIKFAGITPFEEEQDRD